MNYIYIPFKRDNKKPKKKTKRPEYVLSNNQYSDKQELIPDNQAENNTYSRTYQEKIIPPPILAGKANVYKQGANSHSLALMM